MRNLLVIVTLLVAATPARADGWGSCQRCNAAGDSASVGGGLAVIAGVAYGLGRRRKR